MVVNKALSITGLSMVLIFIMTSIIIGIEETSFHQRALRSDFCVRYRRSSTGITPQLHSISKVLLIFTMFLGRVGPLSFAVAIAMRKNKDAERHISGGKSWLDSRQYVNSLVKHQLHSMDRSFAAHKPRGVSYFYRSSSV